MRKLQRAKKVIPASKSEAEERDFRRSADSTEYVDWAAATPMRFQNLRPSSTAISVRLPDTLLTELNLLANERDVPYQSLLKVYLADRGPRGARRARDSAHSRRRTGRGRGVDPARRGAGRTPELARGTRGSCG